MLDTMMEMQRNLQARLGTNFADLNEVERAQFMRNHRGYLEDELAEALYEMPNYKLWKDYSNMSPEACEGAWQKVRMELIDAFHFFMNLLLCAGMTAEEVFSMYTMKNKENFERQDRGYTADVSYRDQAVEEVMEAAPTCTITGIDEALGSSDFIAFVTSADGNVHMVYNTDALSMGIAAKMSAKTFDEMLEALSDEDRENVLECLDGGTMHE